MTNRLRAIGMLCAHLAVSILLVAGALRLVDRARPSGGEIVVGSKRFTESVVLAEIVARELESSGIPVRREFFLGGTHICFEALRSGAIDLYPEYTGTGLTAILGRPPSANAAEVMTLVRREFASHFDVTWLDSLGFSDAYALAMPRRRAQALGIHRISDLLGRKDLTAGFASEFLAREDGWPGLATRYGLSFARGPLGMEAGLMYKAAVEGEVDVISAYSTDGRLETLDFVLLEDDKGFFPPYEAALLVRRASLARVPRAGAILARLDGRIGEEDMRRMNAEVDEGRLSAAQAAQRFLAERPISREVGAPR